MTPMLGILASQITGHLSTNSFESIATVTVGSGGQSSISFTSIPSTYKHLQLRCFAAGAGSQRFGIRFNGDTGANYYSHFLYGTGSAAGAGAAASANTSNTIGASGGTDTVFGATVTDILDYTNTNKNKTIRSLTGYDGNGNGLAVLYSFLWSNTSTVTSLTLQASETYSGNFAQYSSFALYGIKG